MLSPAVVLAWGYLIKLADVAAYSVSRGCHSFLHPKNSVYIVILRPWVTLSSRVMISSKETLQLGWEAQAECHLVPLYPREGRHLQLPPLAPQSWCINSSSLWVFSILVQTAPLIFSVFYSEHKDMNLRILCSKADTWFLKDIQVFLLFSVYPFMFLPLERHSADPLVYYLALFTITNSSARYLFFEYRGNEVYPFICSLFGDPVAYCAQTAPFFALSSEIDMLLVSRFSIGKRHRPCSHN